MVSFLVLILGLFTYFPKPVLAIGVIKCDTEAMLDAQGLFCLEGIFDNLLSKVVVLVGIGSFLMLMVGGFKYITAGGDMKAIDTAKKTITYAVLGFIITVIIYFIFSVILARLGLLNFLQFEVPSRFHF